MELRRYLRLFRRWWILIVVTTVVGCAVGYATASHATAYTATAEIYVGNRHPAQDPIQLEEVNAFNQILQTYAAMIPSAVFAEKAVAATGVPRSAGAAAAETSASVVTNTDLVTVTVTDPDAQVAAKLANGMADAFVSQVQANPPAAPTSSGVVPQEPAYLFQSAGVPAAPVGTGVKRRLILSAVFALVVALLAVLLIDYLRRSAAEEEAAAAAPPPGQALPPPAGEPPATNGSADQPARSGG